MKRVLQIGMTSNIGGMETYIMAQYRHLNRDKVRYDFLNITGENKIVYHDEILKNGDEIYAVPSRRKKTIIHYLSVLYMLLSKRKKYDALVLNRCSLDYVYPIFIAWLLGIPMRVIHSHNSGDEMLVTDKKNSFIRRCIIGLNRMLVRLSATDYWACSKLAGQWMFGDNTPFKVIHNAIDIERFIYKPDIRLEVRKKLKIPNSAYVIGNVARFSYQKNQEFLIDVFQEIYRRDSNAFLLLIGANNGFGDYENKVKRRVRDYQLEDNIIFLGMRDDVNKIYQAMDCFVLTSLFEGLCISAIEAQTACLPCVCSDVLPQEAVVTSRFYSISLSTSPSKWAEVILQQKSQKRYDISEEITRAGYDINLEVKKVERMFMNS